MEKACLITAIISAITMIIGIIIMAFSPNGTDTTAMIGTIITIVSIIVTSVAFSIVGTINNFNPLDPDTWF